jgi:hypothetical protein
MSRKGGIKWELKFYHAGVSMLIRMRSMDRVIEFITNLAQRIKRTSTGVQFVVMYKKLPRGWLWWRIRKKNE